ALKAALIRSHGCYPKLELFVKVGLELIRYHHYLQMLFKISLLGDPHHRPIYLNRKVYRLKILLVLSVRHLKRDFYQSLSWQSRLSSPNLPFPMMVDDDGHEN